jgi:hypothetical protein
MPHSLAAFPVLDRFIVHDPWLADPDVRAERMWEAEGWNGHRYTLFIMRNGGTRALGMLMRDGALHYWRLYSSYAVAVRDGHAWSREITLEPETGLLSTGGVDKHRRTWSVRVVRRQRHSEVHSTNGGLIPSVRDFTEHEDAELAADKWLTDSISAKAKTDDEKNRCPSRSGRARRGVRAEGRAGR